MDMEVLCSAEDTPLGTAGALMQAVSRHTCGEDFVAMNGDTLAEIDFAALQHVHTRHCAQATMALARVEDSSRYGRVEIDDDQRVTAFIEKSNDYGEALINAGVYLLRGSVFDGVARDQAVSLEREVLPGLIGRGLYAVPACGYFIDIGIPEDCRRAQIEFKERY